VGEDSSDDDGDQMAKQSRRSGLRKQSEMSEMGEKYKVV
jgi:hypothetical protein